VIWVYIGSTIVWLLSLMIQVAEHTLYAQCELSSTQTHEGCKKRGEQG